MIFLELQRYGDFDMSYTESIWYKLNPTSVELALHKGGALLHEMLMEFKKLSGEKFTLGEETFLRCRSMYCDKKEDSVLKAFKDYLNARGYRLVETMKLQFSDEGLNNGV